MNTHVFYYLIYILHNHQTIGGVTLEYILVNVLMLRMKLN